MTNFWSRFINHLYLFVGYSIGGNREEQAMKQPCFANFINCQFYKNQQNGITATSLAVVNLYGEATSVYQNGHCGMYVSSKRSVFFLFIFLFIFFFCFFYFALLGAAFFWWRLLSLTFWFFFNTSLSPLSKIVKHSSLYPLFKTCTSLGMLKIMPQSTFVFLRWIRY